ncbi:MAG: rRNA pseudouridine synthase [Firmicutes bacterium]|nr:rRNA pseudouridine synthase [Bacillota bacterium]
MRIDKFLSNLKYGSRSEMKSFLKQHEVFIDNIRVILTNFEMDEFNDTVYLDGKPIFYKYPIYLAINKPQGYLSANRDNQYPCVVDLLKEPYNRFDYAIAGRLDLDSEGLLILTTDGSFAHQITLPKSHVPKTYEVLLDRDFKDSKALICGVTIKDGRNQLYEAKALEIHSEFNQAWITIDEGKFHQVKRMFEAIGYLVLKLKRIQIGQLKLNDLPYEAYFEFRKENLYD